MTPVVTVNGPAAKNARYVAIGSFARQRNVVVPSPDVRRETRAPLLTTSLPSGTVMLTSIRALSDGWSLAGNHHGAMCGSSTVTTSCSSACQLLSPRYSASAGVPAYVTVTLKRRPSAIGFSGVMTSSCSVSCEYVAGPVLSAYLRDGQQEVEGELLQRLGGDDRQGRRAAQLAGVEVVGVPDPVPRDVDARATVEREVRVADPGHRRRGLRRLRRAATRQYSR